MNKKKLVNITDAVLSVSLKELIEDELIKRVQYESISVKVEYSLTEKGLSVVLILQNICKWSGLYYDNKDKKDIAIVCFIIKANNYFFERNDFLCQL